MDLIIFFNSGILPLGAFAKVFPPHNYSVSHSARGMENALFSLLQQSMLLETKEGLRCVLNSFFLYLLLFYFTVR